MDPTCWNGIVNRSEPELAVELCKYTYDVTRMSNPIPRFAKQMAALQNVRKQRYRNVTQAAEAKHLACTCVKSRLDYWTFRRVERLAATIAEYH